MKTPLTLVFILVVCALHAQVENLIIVTTDGFRWQEVFKGMDETIARNKQFNQGDSVALFKEYGAPTEMEKRRKLMPFLWDSIAHYGQVYGNRLYGNKVDNANPYWFSFPGYSEIFCGFVDTLINTNAYKPNPNTNVLEFINKHDAFKGKVAVFGAWSAFDRIFNRERSGLLIVCGGDSCGMPHPDAEQRLINNMKRDTYNPFAWEEYPDVFTHYAAMDYLKKQKPRVLYISYGETDEWAHFAQYHDYLNAAHQVDQWLHELWNFVQSDAQYKNKTALFVTVDHGRGDVIKDQWTSHNASVSDSHEMWFAVMGPGIPAKGEVKQPAQIWQKQFAQTFTELLGLNFTCEHPVAPGLKSMLVK